MSELPDDIKQPADLDLQPFDTVLVKRPLTGDRWVLWVTQGMTWRVIDHNQEPRDNSLVYSPPAGVTDTQHAHQSGTNAGTRTRYRDQ